MTSLTEEEKFECLVKDEEERRKKEKKDEEERRKKDQLSIRVKQEVNRRAKLYAKLLVKKELLYAVDTAVVIANESYNKVIELINEVDTMIHNLMPWYNAVEEAIIIAYTAVSSVEIIVQSIEDSCFYNYRRTEKYTDTIYNNALLSNTAADSFDTDYNNGAVKGDTQSALFNPLIVYEAKPGLSGGRRYLQEAANLQIIPNWNKKKGFLPNRKVICCGSIVDIQWPKMGHTNYGYMMGRLGLVNHVKDATFEIDNYLNIYFTSCGLYIYLNKISFPLILFDIFRNPFQLKKSHTLPGSAETGPTRFNSPRMTIYAALENINMLSLSFDDHQRYDKDMRPCPEYLDRIWDASHPKFCGHVAPEIADLYINRRILNIMPNNYYEILDKYTRVYTLLNKTNK